LWWAARRAAVTPRSNYLVALALSREQCSGPEMTCQLNPDMPWQNDFLEIGGPGPSQQVSVC
jgi:hypothetical protein